MAKYSLLCVPIDFLKTQVYLINQGDKLYLDNHRRHIGKGVRKKENVYQVAIESVIMEIIFGISLGFCIRLVFWLFVVLFIFLCIVFCLIRFFDVLCLLFLLLVYYALHIYLLNTRKSNTIVAAHIKIPNTITKN